MDGFMSIGEFSERSGLSPKRLRSYASAGLLPPAAVDPDSGYRYYAPGQLHEASVIDALRRADVPLSEICALLSNPSPQQVDRWAQQLDQDNDERQAALEHARDLLGMDTEAEGVSTRTIRKGEQTMHLRAASCSDIGPVRKANQDRALDRQHLIAIADGMGESPRGETASSLTMAVVEAAYTGRSLDELHAAARAANIAVFERARSHDQFEDMGTTLCAVGLTDDGELALVNVGDSRAYLCRDGSLHRLTTDHTLVAELVRQGELAEDDIARHPQRSILTRAVGVGPTIEPDAATHDARPGDRLLLCSDGLSNEVADDMILSLMTSARDLDETAQALVDHALASGSQDNTTVVVAEVSA